MLTSTVTCNRNIVRDRRKAYNAMDYIPAPDVVQAELIYTLDAQVCENVLHFQCASTVDPTKMTALGLFLQGWYNTNMKPLKPAALSLNMIKLTDLSAQMAPVISYTTGLPIVGTLADAALPNNVALVITKRTLLRGRSYRGRIYDFPLCEGKVTANAVTGTHVTNLLTAYGLLVNFTASGTVWDMCVVSRKNNGAWRTTADSNQVTTLDSDGSVDSQRRRLPTRIG